MIMTTQAKGQALKSQDSRPVYIALAKNIYLRTQISLMLLEAAFNQLFCLKFSFKLVTFSENYARNQKQLFFSEHSVQYNNSKLWNDFQLTLKTYSHSNLSNKRLKLFTAVFDINLLACHLRFLLLDMFVVRLFGE